MSIETKYVIGIILCVGALVTLTSQPVLSSVIAACAVITLGSVLRKLL